MNFECMKIVCMAFSIVPAFCNGISSKDSQLVAKTIGTENEERPFIPRHASSTAGNIMSGHHVLKQLIIPEESSEEQFPYVDVTISHPTDDNSTYTENVAVSPDMTVIDAMIQATLSYRGRSGSDIDIPFNVMLDWDDTDDCFVIKRALGKNSRRRAGWSLTVKNMFQKATKVQLLLSLKKLDPKTGSDADAVPIAGTDGDNGKPILQLATKSIQIENEQRPIGAGHAFSTTGNIISGHPLFKHLIIPMESSGKQFVGLNLETALENEIKNLENVKIADNSLPRELLSSQGRPLVSDQLKGADSAKNSEKIAPNVDVTISHPTDDNSTYTENVAVSPDMTVIDAMIQATLSYRARSGLDVDIPFNVMISWDNVYGCFVIRRALGKKSRRRAGWSITVKNMFQKEEYTDRCIPFDEVILRPFSSVSITYKRNQK
ncbi:hypothetical protein MAR_005008 [Mya arenaria]|uniref:Uncharacterized protein n=1 Tax=Mya arenaria TaxID=6604 RepID=A0ABY7F2D4_MYAAR|nr:hypothetical protein MAR_005008 [Mya arenaria]